MKSQLDSLRQHSLVVADTGDIDAVARWKPRDATTNPSLLLVSAEDPRYQPIVDKAMRLAEGDVALAMDALFVLFGVEILKHVAGRVSTEVDARLSFDTAGSIDRARRLGHAQVALDAVQRRRRDALQRAAQVPGRIRDNGNHGVFLAARFRPLVDRIPHPAGDGEGQGGGSDGAGSGDGGGCHAPEITPTTRGAQRG